MGVDEEWAERVLQGVLAELPRSSLTESRAVTVIDAWALPPDRIYVLYRLPGYAPVIGLARALDADLPEPVLVHEVVNFEIGEPLGTAFDADHVDTDGIFWWDGAAPTIPDNPRRPNPHR